MSEFLGSRAERKGWDELGTGVGSDPEPFGFRRAVEFWPDFVELDMRQMKGTQEALMEIAGMLAGACEPAAKRGLRSGEHAGRGAGAEPFGDGVQRLGDAGGRSFQAIERGVPAGSELTSSSLAI